MSRKEANYLEDYEAENVLSKLALEPIKWKVSTILLIYSGMRRGELMGLEWKDIDFNNHVIHICRTSQYVSSMGIITKDTKNSTSTRTIKLPPEAFTLLEEYHSWWLQTQNDMGDKWQNKIEITYADGKKEIVDNDRLFIKDDSTPMNPDSITDWTRNFIEKYNLPKFTPHSLSIPMPPCSLQMGSISQLCQDAWVIPVCLPQPRYTVTPFSLQMK